MNANYEYDKNKVDCEALNKIICENIRLTCKVRKTPLGDLEESLGISRGYFSRHKNISVSLALRTALLLDVKLEDLISVDYNIFIKGWATRQRIEELKREIAELERSEDMICAEDEETYRILEGKDD